MKFLVKSASAIKIASSCGIQSGKTGCGIQTGKVECGRQTGKCGIQSGRI